MDNRKMKLKHLNELRGVFALEIIVGHVVDFHGCLLYPLAKFMICSVAFFFFISAYGMVVSCKNKKNYLTISFLVNKPVYLLIVSIGIYIINATIDFVSKLQIGYCTNFFSLSHFFCMTNWYVWELMFFYLLFWIVYKCAYKYREIIIVCITVLCVIILYFNQFSEAWIASAFAFPLGITYGEHFEIINNVIYSIKGYIFVALLSVFGLFSLLVKTENLLSMVFMRNAICIAAIAFIIYLSEIHFLRNNAVTRFLTKYSTGLFFMQFISLKISENYNLSYWTRIIFVVFITLFTAVLLVNPMTGVIKKCLNLAVNIKPCLLRENNRY